VTDQVSPVAEERQNAPYITILDNIHFRGLAIQSSSDPILDEKLDPLRIALDLLAETTLEDGYLPDERRHLSLKIRIHMRDSKEHLLWDAYRGLCDPNRVQNRQRIFGFEHPSIARLVEGIDRSYILLRMKETSRDLLITGSLASVSNHKRVQLAALKQTTSTR
jgi:hypothetical protein